MFFEQLQLMRFMWCTSCSHRTMPFCIDFSFFLFSVIDNRQENGLILFFLFSFLFSLLTNWQSALKEACEDGNRIERNYTLRVFVIWAENEEGKKTASFLFGNKNICTHIIKTFLVDLCKNVQLCNWLQQQLWRQTDCRPASLQKQRLMCLPLLNTHTVRERYRIKQASF